MVYFLKDPEGITGTIAATALTSKAVTGTVSIVPRGKTPSLCFGFSFGFACEHQLGDVTRNRGCGGDDQGVACACFVDGCVHGLLSKDTALI